MKCSVNVRLTPIEALLQPCSVGTNPRPATHGTPKADIKSRRNSGGVKRAAQSPRNGSGKPNLTRSPSLPAAAFCKRMFGGCSVKP